jgi:uncharacterized membrane protein
VCIPGTSPQRDRLYLIYTKLFTLNAVCLWCTSVHIITILLFALIVPTATARTGTQRNPATRQAH